MFERGGRSLLSFLFFEVVSTLLLLLLPDELFSHSLQLQQTILLRFSPGCSLTWKWLREALLVPRLIFLDHEHGVFLLIQPICKCSCFSHRSLETPNPHWTERSPSAHPNPGREHLRGVCAARQPPAVLGHSLLCAHIQTHRVHTFYILDFSFLRFSSRVVWGYLISLPLFLGKGHRGVD